MGRLRGCRGGRGLRGWRGSKGLWGGRDSMGLRGGGDGRGLRGNRGHGVVGGLRAARAIRDAKYRFLPVHPTVEKCSRGRQP